MKNRLKIPVPEPLPPTVQVPYTDDEVAAQNITHVPVNETP